MTTYSLVDIPETEAMLNNPNYSKIVSSAAALVSKNWYPVIIYLHVWVFKDLSPARTNSRSQDGGRCIICKWSQ